MKTTRLPPRAIAKERAIVAGTEVAAEVFRRVDPALRVEIAQKDGAIVAGGTAVLEVRGRARSILTAERVALNFLQRPQRDRDLDSSIRRSRRRPWREDSRHAQDDAGLAEV